MSAPTTATPQPVPPQRRTRAATGRTAKAKPATEPIVEPTPEAPTDRVPAPVPPGVESPITIYGITFDPDHEPIGAQLAAELAYTDA